jgi:hypothetical protein
MAIKEFDKEDWKEFRNEILELVILYNHVKEYSDFDKNKIEYIKSFFHLSRKQAITSFFIKVGFLVTDGSPTLKNFLGKEDYDELMKIYISKVGLVRDKLYAHNAKTDGKMKNFTLSNGDVEELYTNIISSAQAVDNKFDDRFHYDFVHNTDGIKSIESYIADSIELDTLKHALRTHDFKANVELEIMSGKIKIVEEI